MGNESFKEFFNALNKTNPVSLQLSKDVLRLRQSLKIRIHGLNDKIEQALKHRHMLEREKKFIKENKEKINKNEKVVFEREQEIYGKIETQGYFEHVVCKNEKCKKDKYDRACHIKCWSPHVMLCCIMNKDGLCDHCGCPRELHQKQSFYYGLKKSEPKVSTWEKVVVRGGIATGTGVGVYGAITALSLIGGVPIVAGATVVAVGATLGGSVGKILGTDTVKGVGVVVEGTARVAEKLGVSAVGRAVRQGAVAVDTGEKVLEAVRVAGSALKRAAVGTVVKEAGDAEETLQSARDIVAKSRGNVSRAEAAIESCNEQIRICETYTAESINFVTGLINELEKIALNKNVTSTKDYIEELIQMELSQKKDGYMDRVNGLRNIANVTETAHKIKMGMITMGKIGNNDAPMASANDVNDFDGAGAIGAALESTE